MKKRDFNGGFTRASSHTYRLLKELGYKGSIMESFAGSDMYIFLIENDKISIVDRDYSTEGFAEFFLINGELTWNREPDMEGKFVKKSAKAYNRLRELGYEDNSIDRAVMNWDYLQVKDSSIRGESRWIKINKPEDEVYMDGNIFTYVSSENSGFHDSHELQRMDEEDYKGEEVADFSGSYVDDETNSDTEKEEKIISIENPEGELTEFYEPEGFSVELVKHYGHYILGVVIDDGKVYACAWTLDGKQAHQGGIMNFTMYSLKPVLKEWYFYEENFPALVTYNGETLPVNCYTEGFLCFTKYNIDAWSLSTEFWKLATPKEADSFYYEGKVK